MASVPELRQILKEDANGKSLYDHLVQTLMKIILDRPKDAYDSFEIISSEIKANPLDPSPIKGRTITPSEEEVSKISKFTTVNATLLKVPEEPPDEGDVKYPDLISEAALYEWAGVTIGRTDLYRLYLSIKSFAATLPSDVERLRFFGKVTTRGKPYYVVEGLSTEDEDNIDEMKQEGRSGVNKYAYWISQRVDGADGWTKLPNVTSNQIVVARQIKRLLTGDLDASVPSYPPFDGTEKNLLRAQIALLVGSTSISPDGFFELDEDAEPPVAKPAEPESIAEIFPKSASDLNSVDSWRVHEAEVNQIGRITALPEQLDENGDVIEPDESSEIIAPLQPIKPEEWTLRVAPGGAGFAAGSAVVARSLVWPGAVAVAAGSRFVNIYVGSAVPFSALAYSPPLPKEIQEEFSEELVEQEDVRVDPTPPVPEAEEGEEDD